MIIPKSIVSTLKNTAKKLTGIKKRQFMAEAVNNLGKGAQRAAERQLNWCRNTIIKGQKELASGINCIDNFSARGRKKAEEKNPNLIKDIEAIVEDNYQADPSLKSEMLFDRMLLRKKGQNPLAESWHRDVCSKPPKSTLSKGDNILGGWLNLDDNNQFFYKFSLILQ